jgi:hypothetical protein
MSRAPRLAAAAFGLLALGPARAGADGIPWTPPRPRGTTAVTATVRPFVHLLAPGWGALSHLRVAHYFERPLVLSVEASPLALVVESGGGGAIAHLRAHAAYVDDVLEVGVGLGGRLQRWGQSGLSLAGVLRLGALDGLHASLEYVYSLVANYYTRRRRLLFSNVSGNIAVPLGTRTAAELEGGLGFDFWLYGTLGLRHRLRGEGGAGTFDIRAGAGLAWIVDRFPCQYQDPTPCVGAAGAVGPTITAGIERRF